MGQERGSACTIPTEPPLWAGILSLTVFFSCIPVFGTLLPFYVEDVLGESRSWVGVGISSYYIAATLGMAVTGWLSDVIGIRRVIIGACIGNVALLNCVTLVHVHTTVPQGCFVLQHAGGAAPRRERTLRLVVSFRSFVSKSSLVAGVS